MAIFAVEEKDTGILLAQGTKTSAFAAGGVQFINVPKGTQNHFMTVVGPTEYHEHAFGDAEDKPLSNTPTTKVPVTMTSLSHQELFDNRLFTPQSAAMELIRRLPETAGLAIDKFLAKRAADATDAWGGWTGTPGEINRNPASFLEVQDALSDAGYEPTLSVWTNQAKSLIRGQLNNNTQRSELAVAVRDGVAVGDTTAYFRALYKGALVEGSPLGFVLDPAFTKVFYTAPENVIVVTEETDSTLGGKNAFYAKIELLIGVGTVQNSVVPLVADLTA